jgi:hypothetical protein
MAINPFFGDFKNEQSLVNDLTIETIKAMGRDVYYIPREYLKLDRLFGEDTMSKFTKAYMIEMYVQDVQRFDGQRDVISKFGIEITDRLTLQVAITRFNQEIRTREPSIKKPRPGDLIYFPLSKHIFEINYVEDEIPFYQHGGLTTYTLTCEAFTYSNEEIETGITDVDAVEDRRKMFLTKITLGTQRESATNFKKGEFVYQGNSYSDNTYSATVVDFVQGGTRLLYVSDETGTLVSGTDLYNESDTVGYDVTSSETTIINVSKDPEILESALDNRQLDILDNTNNIFDFSEKDPFSEGFY